MSGKKNYRFQSFKENYDCGSCEKVFSSLFGLNLHTKHVHKEKPSIKIVCKKCGVGFLKTEINKHSAEHEKVERVLAKRKHK